MCAVGVVLLVAMAYGPTAGAETSPKLQMTATVDLDGDGRADRVKLTPLERCYGAAFTLTVNGVSLTDKLLLPVDGFEIADIDENDRYREIGVHTCWENDNAEYLFVWYDGAGLHRAGHVVGGPQYLGHGVLLTHYWGAEFWWRTDKYELTGGHKLRLVPQELYWVGDVKPTKRGFPIYSRRDADVVQANVRDGSNVLVVAVDCHDQDEGQWRYLIRTENGQLGWTKGNILDLVLGNAGKSLFGR